MKSAIIGEAKYYLIAVTIALAFILYLYLIQTLTVEKIPGLLVLMSNIWGLFLIVLMLGYGLVSIPISFWNKGDLKKTLNMLQMKAPPIEDTKNLCDFEIKDLFKKVQAIKLELAEQPELLIYVDLILQEFPNDVLSSIDLRSSFSDSNQKNSVKTKIKYRDLVDINSQIKNLICEKERIHR